MNKKNTKNGVNGIKAETLKGKGHYANGDYSKEDVEGAVQWLKQKLMKVEMQRVSILKFNTHVKKVINLIGEAFNLEEKK